MKGFGTLDYVVLVGYLLLVASIGASFYRRRSTTRDYFLGGKKMSWLPVGISIVAADTSAITLMGDPGWSYQHNLEIVWMYVGYALAAPIVILLFIPFYSRLNLFTAYEYLERRFGLSVRITTSLLFQFLRCTHVAIAIYAPAIALSLVTRLTLWQCVLLMGAVTTVYTTSGGMKAVIWTDVIQFCTVCIGLALVFVVGIGNVHGGLGAVWNIGANAGRFHIVNLSTDPAQTTSIWACLVGGVLLSLSAMATDQAILQRLFTTKSEKDCAQSVIVNAAISLPLMTLLLLLGVVLFAFYSQNPTALEGLKTPDGVFPLFAIRQLPPGVAGLVIAAIFAASMGVMSASINSLSTATTVDFYQRLVNPNASAQHHALFGRIATATWGILATCLALFMDRLGELALAYNKVSSFISTPLLGIFLLAILTRRCNAGGALFGAATGTAVVALLSSYTNWTFFYQLPVGVAVTFTTGYFASFIGKVPPEDKIAGLVFRYPAPSAGMNSFTAGLAESEE
ncbi:MAG: sodium/solute symporter [Bryobacteraceae bacterium]